MVILSVCPCFCPPAPIYASIPSKCPQTITPPSSISHTFLCFPPSPIPHSPTYPFANYSLRAVSDATGCFPSTIAFRRAGAAGVAPVTAHLPVIVVFRYRGRKSFQFCMSVVKSSLSRADEDEAQRSLAVSVGTIASLLGGRLRLDDERR